MNRRLKIGVLLALATAVGMLGILSMKSTLVRATPIGGSALTSPMALNSSQNGTVTYTDESGPATLFVTGPAGVAFTACSVTDTSATPGAVTFTSPSTTCTVADDGDTLVETATIAFTLACGSNAGTADLSFGDAGGFITNSVTCEPATPIATSTPISGAALGVTANPAVVTNCSTFGGFGTTSISVTGATPGSTVTFTATGGTVSPPSAVASSTGLASTTLTLTSSGFATVGVSTSSSQTGSVTVTSSCVDVCAIFSLPGCGNPCTVLGLGCPNLCTTFGCPGAPFAAPAIPIQAVIPLPTATPAPPAQLPPLVPAARAIVPPSTGDAGLASECTD